MKCMLKCITSATSFEMYLKGKKKGLVGGQRNAQDGMCQSKYSTCPQQHRDVNTCVSSIQFFYKIDGKGNRKNPVDSYSKAKESKFPQEV